jgi:hypothetical protein
MPDRFPREPAADTDRQPFYLEECVETVVLAQSGRIQTFRLWTGDQQNDIMPQLSEGLADLHYLDAVGRVG